MAIIAAQSADELLSITGILASFVLCQIDEVVMISGRSLGDINVQAILENMGGGGHRTMAACQLKEMNFEKAKQLLIYAIKKNEEVVVGTSDGCTQKHRCAAVGDYNAAVAEAERVGLLVAYTK